MSDLIVTTNHLKTTLASTQSKTASMAASAATVAEGIKDDLWITHGVISGRSNTDLTNAESERRFMVTEIGNICNALGLRLGEAAQKYDRTDADAAESFDQQVLDK